MLIDFHSLVGWFLIVMPLIFYYLAVWANFRLPFFCLNWSSLPSEIEVLYNIAAIDN